jgi:hypothetical protein
LNPGERVTRKSPLILTEAGWPTHPSVITYVERELVDQLWLAEMGFSVSEERPSPVFYR